MNYNSPVNSSVIMGMVGVSWTMELSWNSIMSG